MPTSFFFSFFLCLCLLSAFRSQAGDTPADAYREGRAALAARRYADAAARFETAARATNDMAAAAWFGRGEALYGLKQWKPAMAAYETLLKRYPDHALAPAALFARGCAEQQTGDLQHALATFTAFRKAYPKHALNTRCATAIGLISKTLDAQARQQAVLQVARELAAINDAVRAEKFDEASAAVTRFMHAHPDHPQTAELHYLQAACAYRMHAYDRAIGLYRAFLTRYPRHVRAAAAHIQLGDSLMQAGHYQDALTYYIREIGTAQTSDDEARDTLAIGDCYTALRLWDEAERAYLKVEVLQDCDALRPVALKRLAALYDKTGQPDKARRTREDLQSRYPNQH